MILWRREWWMVSNVSFSGKQRHERDSQSQLLVAGLLNPSAIDFRCLLLVALSTTLPSLQPW